MSENPHCRPPRPRLFQASGQRTAISEYLTAILEDGDASLLAAALGDIARARGMAQIAAGAGIGREALYKALRPGAQPRFDTVQRVCAALGFKLVARPVGRA